MVWFVCHLGDEFKYCSFGLLYLDSFSSGLLALLYFMVVGRMTGRHFLESGSMWQGHFWLINWLRYVLVIEPHFVKLIFPFGEFIFLRVFGITTNIRQIRYCVSIEEPVKTFLSVDWFLETCNTFRKASNVFSLFLGCMWVCVFDRRDCSDLFLLFISFFWVWRAFL